ncbi:asparagine synthase-related protein [Pokkaliibacter sp. MBI-7]|uniref:asparagine synthetase B family protein n=1 Tax=Pokkaliibacter sp. MBI-7 TaxID=3040600 RepID=UPI002449469F|nr:asparagine synthase-related protein [Pokkaliibacter sp. MBI-7]MDH2433073.1 asparagine synthase-related protein [Pokkaliibacter sp. MBI-7]
MCGVILLAGPAAAERLPACLQRLSHRGPDARLIWQQGAVSIGFARLSINDPSPAGGQPVVYENLVSAINGEIFNAPELRDCYALALASSNDCHVIPALIHQRGLDAITALDGFFAGVLYDAHTHHLYCLRDPLGKKPLFVGRSGSELFICSELKAVGQVDHFQEVPSGLSRLDLQTGELTQLVSNEVIPQAPAAQAMSVSDKLASLRRLLTTAVNKRLPAAQDPFGVFLSGGLDSSIVTALVHAQRQNVVYYTLSSGSAEDEHYVQLLADQLKLTTLRVVPLPAADELDTLIRRLVYTTESYNPSVISNGLCTYLLAQAARKDGLKVVLSGEGADELFGGYHHLAADAPWQETRQQLLADLRNTELRRVDLTCMAHGIETRCPFMDRELVAWALALAHGDLYRRSATEKSNKLILRLAMEGTLPPEILWRPKVSCDVGSGMRQRVVGHLRQYHASEREALKAIWRTQFSRCYPALDEHPYFSAYPVMDALIDRRGSEHR